MQQFKVSSMKVPMKQLNSKLRTDRPFLVHNQYDDIQRNYSLTVDIIIDEVEYKALGGKKVLNFRTIRNKFNHEVIADTGAYVCCTSPEEVKYYGIDMSETLKSSLQLFAADGRKLNVRGSIPVKIFAATYDAPKIVKEILYFVDGFQNTILSRKALKELGSVSPNFPEIASINLITSRKAIKYSDVVKRNLANKSYKVNPKKTEAKADKLHLQQKVASATRSSIMLINAGGREITDSVDVVTVVSSAPLLRRSTGSTPVASATYWRPWD